MMESKVLPSKRIEVRDPCLMFNGSRQKSELSVTCNTDFAQ